jgi:hypothetical protein
MYCFVIKVVDDKTGRGVPLVELRTVHEMRFWTDSAGVVAIDTPELMGQEVFFHISSHGYAYPKDGFGYAGSKIKITPNGQATLKVTRINIAERLYRITGAGIYAESVKAGLTTVSSKYPLLNANVFGSDTVETVIYNNKLYWFWGDTNRPSYPLGNFSVPGATSAINTNPDKGIDLAYFIDAKTEFAKETCHMPGDGPTWISAPTVLKDTKDTKSNNSQMVAGYVKVKDFLTVYERGVVLWDDTQKQFVKYATFPKDAPLYPFGHALQQDGYVYFFDPFPFVRVKATLADFCNPNAYEALTASGWQKNASMPSLKNDTRWHLRAADTNKTIIPHAGTISWNAYRKRWVFLIQENGGTSPLGEIWYTESETIHGPFTPAVKIITHDKYTFYNPLHHAYWDEKGGQVIYFEATYTTFFAGSLVPTPRYDYNQILYRLDLADTRLKPAQ